MATSPARYEVRALLVNSIVFESAPQPSFQIKRIFPTIMPRTSSVSSDNSWLYPTVPASPTAPYPKPAHPRSLSPVSMSRREPHIIVSFVYPKELLDLKPHEVEVSQTRAGRAKDDGFWILHVLDSNGWVLAQSEFWVGVGMEFVDKKLSEGGSGVELTFKGENSQDAL